MVQATTMWMGSAAPTAEWAVDDDERLPFAEPDADKGLLQQFLAGDIEAFERLVNRYRTELHAFLYRALGNHAAAEDVAQETLLRLYRSARQFESDRGLRPWLFSIAANAARDYYRYHARRPAASLQSPAHAGEPDGAWLAHLQADEQADPPHAQVERRELGERIGRTIDRMPPHLSEILRLAYFRQLSYREMSEALEIPLGTVKSRLHAAVAHFAERWDRQNPASRLRARGR